MDNFIKALVMDNVEAEINKPYPVIDMSLGRGKKMVLFALVLTNSF